MSVSIYVQVGRFCVSTFSKRICYGQYVYVLQWLYVVIACTYNSIIVYTGMCMYMYVF